MEPTNDAAKAGEPEKISVVGGRDPAAAQTAQPDAAKAGEPEKISVVGGRDPAAAPEKKAEEPKAAAPESYTFAMPQGYTVDEAAMEKVTPLLKELGCSQETAQKLADFHFEQLKAAEEAREQARIAAIAEWTNELKTDSEIGGPRLKENLLYGSRLLNKYGSPELDRLLVESGLDRHPVVARFLVAAGKALAEDHWADGGRKGPVAMTAGDVAKKLFDKTL